MAALPQARFAKQPLAVIGLSLATGIVICHAIESKGVAIALAVASIALLLFAIRIRARVAILATGSLLLAFMTAGYVLSFLEHERVPADRIVRLFEAGQVGHDEPVEVTGQLEGEPESAPDGFYLNIKTEKIRLQALDYPASGTVLLLAHVGDQLIRKQYEALQLRYGARIRVMTVLDRDEDYRNPGVMPFTEYLERKGYDATGVVKSPLLIERLEDAPVFLPLAWIYEWRVRLEQEFDRRFSPETAGVLDAMLLGNRYRISRGAADRFREGGTFHVLVISGLHISFIAGLLFLLMRRLTRSRAARLISVVLVLAAYSLAVGAQAPVVRAALAFSLGIFAPLVWRRANSLNIIAGAGIVLLVWRPSDLFDPSFQLTFLSVVVIVTLAAPIMLRMQQVGAWRPTHETPYPPSCPPWFRRFSETLFWSEQAWRAEMAASNIRYRLFKTPWASRFERWHLQKALRFGAGAIVVSASVQLGMLPLLIIYFHRISFASLLLNIFVSLLMAVLAFTAIAATLVAQFSTWAAVSLVALSEKIEWLMVHSIDPIRRLGIAAIRLPHYHGVGVLTYVGYFIVLGILAFALARWNPLRPVEITREPDRRLRPAHVGFTLVIFLLLLLLTVTHPFSGPRPDGKLRVDYLDVGQGDSALLTMPDGTTLLIDGGGRPNIDWNRSAEADVEVPFERDTRSVGERVVSEYLWARGLDHVDYLLPTHADADHIDGLNDIAQNFKVRGALVAREPSDNPEYARFSETMRAKRVAIETIGAGDVMRFGEVAISVLWPPPSNETSAPWRNNDGTTLRLLYGNQTFLFAADIEKEAELKIVGAGADLRSDIVKVAHHGSKTSSTQDFINATGALVAIISVGRTSIFGHPNKEVLDRWRASGATVMTTGEKGTISSVTNGKQLAISTFVR